jgi:hypothetical protein
MINIIGLIIIVAGFFLPYLIDVRLPSTYFFWIGGLLSLNKGIIIRGEFKWAKWAQAGILINIAAIVVLLGAHFLIGYGSITRFEYLISTILYWLSSPATSIGQQLFPYPEIHYPNGSIGFKISHSRTILTAFLNVAFFAFILAALGLFWQKKKSEEGNSEQCYRSDRE